MKKMNNIWKEIQVGFLQNNCIKLYPYLYRQLQKMKAAVQYDTSGSQLTTLKILQVRSTAALRTTRGSQRQEKRIKFMGISKKCYGKYSHLII